MKKNLIISLLAIASFFVIQNCANAESVLEPQWAEFCPPLYENAVLNLQKKTVNEIWKTITGH